MDSLLKSKLEVERAKGESYQRAWEHVIQPFFENKQRELYEVFLESKTSSVDDLVTIKMQSNVMSMLEDEVQHYINTGLLASATLEKEESNDH